MTRCSPSWCWKFALGSWLVMGSTIGEAVLQTFAFSFNCALAQITPDSTLPNNSSVTTQDNIRTIEGGTQAGRNLFHSFEEFSVPTGSTAFFNNVADIQNIISRVTGGSASNIDGLIRANGTANLFLINPNGIIFRQNAQLNIGGSFVASTANALQFGNIGFFSATEKNIPSPLLTINPSALLLNQINQNAAIQNNSIAPAGKDPAGFDGFGLRVPNGKSLLLVGGNINIDGGGLNANGGRVELGGLSEPGTVALLLDGDNLSLRFPENVTQADISFTNRAGVFVEAAGGGNIAVNAKNLEILGGSILSGGIGQSLGTPETVAGDITLNATESIKVATGSVVFNLVYLGSQGNGGNITIDSGSFSLRDRAELAASTAGRGNAGNVTVNAKDTISLLDASILSTVSARGIGKGGNIDINAASLSLIGDAKLQTSTSGQGNAGNVTVSAKDTISLADGDIFSTVEAGGVGKGGNININAASLSLTEGAQLLTITGGAFNTQPAGRGDAGNVNINVTGSVDIAGRKKGLGLVSGIGSAVETGTVGNGGNITINSGSFSLRDGAQLTASTAGQGNAGNVTVSAKNAVDLADAAILSTVEAGGVGKGGNININAATLSLKDGAQLLTLTRAAFDTQPPGQRDGGNVNINVTGSVDIAGKNNNNSFSGISSLVNTGTVGNGGNITINSGSFSLRDRAQLAASTFGEGNAGNVTVSAKNAVSFAGNAYIFSTVEAEGVGKGGNIDINAAKVSLIDGALLSASTFGQGNAGNVTVSAKDTIDLAGAGILTTVESGGVGKGGNIDINATTLSLIDGAQLLTSTNEAFNNQPAGRGDAGNVNVNVTGAVNIAGEKSRIFSFVDTGTVGNGGNITIDSGSFSLVDRAQLAASTYGQGNAGTIKVNAADFFTISSKSSNINTGLFVNSQSTTGSAGDILVTSPKVTLDNGGRLNAQSASGNGGDINLETDLLLLRRGASISTTAGTAQAGGNGGNINIDASSGFIVAVPSENSDITAKAYTGNGGSVDIQAFGIYGIQPRSNQTSLSDITASSEFGVNGTVELNTPDVDPNSGLVNLPSVPVDTQLAQTCTAGSAVAKSSFTITGRGGLPPNPGEALSADAVQVDLVSLNPKVGNTPAVFTNPINPTPTRIVEATGWVIAANGDVILTLLAPTPTPHSSWQRTADCSVFNRRQGG
ncbi:filamentous hemagglutinin N-terminal domain-containing protein [Nostoc sp. ChiQUE01b]|uniref:two-partner secretion domain-containing protein n=1 Tax=Nostoc sp. ChiQUE01b TaxID=3075376 RepID=UPI002AD43685|nr:filamentous hemagglutinin N-terminal domain-containing protein [Nostoc sp. ChiQUE01b]MDZ8263509.1 filamentous hemagglutinin N-terminal domain-containing protein [Nostoc sp. ChiQUE01b]